VTSRASRLRAAIRALDHDQRFAAGAATALLLTMVLPWYDKAVVTRGKPIESSTIIGLAALSFVEAAIFLVAAGVLWLLLARAAGGTFQLPFDDGRIVFVAGLWADALLFYRVLDHPADVGIQWGLFVAFLVALGLAFTGQRMHAVARSRRTPRSRRTRPESDRGEDDTELAWSDAPTVVATPSTEPRTPRDRSVRRSDAERLELDDPPEPPTLPGATPRTRDAR
jgi:hypothetical protein